jgi:predicted nucleic acid-binding Zn ribbon protein
MQKHPKHQHGTMIAALLAAALIAVMLLNLNP